MEIIQNSHANGSENFSHHPREVNLKISRRKFDSIVMNWETNQFRSLISIPLIIASVNQLPTEKLIGDCQLIEGEPQFLAYNQTPDW